LKGFLRRGFSFGHGFIGRQRIVRGRAEQRIGIGKAGVSGRVVRVLSDGLLVILNAFVKVLDGALGPVEASVQIGGVSFRIDLSRTIQPQLISGTEIQLQLFRDGPRQIVFQSNNVARVALVTLAPQVLVARAIQQLHGHAHAVP
jgi:hypothetical protein